jgi:cytidine deaminase
VKAAEVERLVEAAKGARAKAYAPYSKYRVGAALLTRAGNVYTGCNVENASYGGTICAERSAVCAMVAAGDREPVACAVVTEGPEPGSPCGICRQVLAEFATEMDVVLVAEAEDAGGAETARAKARLSTLLPRAFRLRAPEKLAGGGARRARAPSRARGGSR